MTNWSTKLLGQVNFEPSSLMFVFEPKHFALAKPKHAKMGIMVFDLSNAENFEGFGWPVNSWVLGLWTFHVGTSAHRWGKWGHRFRMPGPSRFFGAVLQEEKTAREQASLESTWGSDAVHQSKSLGCFLRKQNKEPCKFDMKFECRCQPL